MENIDKLILNDQVRLMSKIFRTDLFGMPFLNPVAVTIINDFIKDFAFIVNCPRRGGRWLVEPSLAISSNNESNWNMMETSVEIVDENFEELWDMTFLRNTLYDFKNCFGEDIDDVTLNAILNTGIIVQIYAGIHFECLMAEQQPATLFKDPNSFFKDIKNLLEVGVGNFSRCVSNQLAKKGINYCIKSSVFNSKRLGGVVCFNFIEQLNRVNNTKGIYP